MNAFAPDSDGPEPFRPANLAHEPQSMAILAPVDPLSDCPLGGTHWQIVAVGGVRVPDDMPLTIAFRHDGRAFGQAGVNRFTVDYVQDGWRLAFGLVFATRFPGEAASLPFATEVLGLFERIRRFRRCEDTLAVIFETWCGVEIRTRPVLP